MRTLLVLILLALMPSEAWAAFANVGSVELEVTSSSADPETVSAVSVPDLGANRVGVVMVIHPAGNVAVSGATWNGDAMTAGPLIEATAQRVYFFYLIGMDENGSYNIVVDYAAATIHTALIVVAWADATGTITIDDTSTGSGTAQNPAITSSQAGSSGIVWSASASNSNGLSGVTSGTVLHDFDATNNCGQAAYSLTASTGDVTHTHNYTDAGSAYAIASLSFQEPGGGGATNAKNCLLLGACE